MTVGVEPAAAGDNQAHDAGGVRIDDAVVAAVGTASALRFLISPLLNLGRSLHAPAIGMEGFNHQHGRWIRCCTSAEAVWPERPQNSWLFSGSAYGEEPAWESTLLMQG